LPKHRGRELLIVSGRNVVLEALKANRAKKIIVRHGASIHFDDIQIPFEVAGRRDFEAKYGFETQGVVCEIDEFEYSDFNQYLQKQQEQNNQENIKGVIVLDKIQDPHNFGAIIRAAHCFGVTDIIVPKHDQAKVTPAVFRASAGSIFYSMIFEVTNLGSAVEDLINNQFLIVAADIGEDALPISQFKPESNRSIAVIIGSEGKGIRESILNRADIKLKIEMNSKIDSLNASMSSAIICYQLFGLNKKSD